MENLITTLEQLYQLRHQTVNGLTGKLSQQKRLCQRYARNIDVLTALCESSNSFSGTSAIQMSNTSGYKRHIQRVIDWQKQEQALVTIQAKNLQANLIREACREKTVEVVLDQQQTERTRERERKDQKITDGMSMQCWMRRQIKPGA